MSPLWRKEKIIHPPAYLFIEVISSVFFNHLLYHLDWKMNRFVVRGMKTNNNTHKLMNNYVFIMSIIAKNRWELIRSLRYFGKTEDVIDQQRRKGRMIFIFVCGWRNFWIWFSFPLWIIDKNTFRRNLFYGD